MRVLDIAVVVTITLVILLIFAIFSLKIVKKFKLFFSKRLDRKIYRVLQSYEKAKPEGSKLKQKALGELKKMKQKVLLRALSISKKDFSDETTGKIIEIAIKRKIPSALGETLLNRRKDKWKRVQSAYELTNFGNEAVYFLKQAINLKEADIAFNSAQALSVIKTEGTFAILLYHLPQLKQFSQSRIADFLQDYVDKGYKVLIKAATDKTPVIRYWTAYLLGRYKTKNSLEWLEKLSDDLSDNVRASAAEGLGSLGFKEASPKLIELLDDKVWFVRNQAVKSLAKLDIKQASGMIADLLRDENWWIRENATEALVGFGKESILVLIPMLDDKDRFARNRASEILERLGFIDEKIHQLKKEPHNKEVLDLLKKIRKAGATSVFEKYLNDQDRELKNQIEGVLSFD